MSRRWLLLLALALGQMAGDVLELDWLRGVAAATAASPAPRVFTNHGAREPFSTRFTLVVHDAQHGAQRMQLTAQRYAQLAGPYNRRNALGAVLAGGPVLLATPLTQPMFHDVARYALCGRAPVLRELGLDVGQVAWVDLEYSARDVASAAPSAREMLRVVCP